MRRLATGVALAAACACALVLGGCQSTSDSDDTLDVDDFVDSSVSPSPATAAESTDGRTYRVARNDTVDDVLTFSYVTTFAVTLTINSNATDDDVDLSFPVELQSCSGIVEQASGGIVTEPTNGETEHYDSVILSSTGSTFSGVNTSQTLNFKVWYTLPSALKEALVTVTCSFKDSDDVTFSKKVKVLVNP
jgi:hypothetical protein